MCSILRPIHMHQRKTKNWPFIILHSSVCLCCHVWISVGLSVLSLLNKALSIYTVHNWAFPYPNRMFWSIWRQQLPRMIPNCLSRMCVGEGGTGSVNCKPSNVLPVPSCWRPAHFLHKWRAPEETKKGNSTLRQALFSNLLLYLSAIFAISVINLF